MTNIEHLIRLANRIGSFFEAMPDRDEALHDIVNHIRHFWEPRMRRALLGFLAEQPDGRRGDTQLSDIVLLAIRSHGKALLE
ncbi:MAG: formate dehydrogenase subunit delta [Castellaniella sp.]